MRINLNHCLALSMPMRACLYLQCTDESCIRPATSLTRFRHFTIRFFASSLLIFFAGMIAATAFGTLTLKGGNLWKVKTNNPINVRPFVVGLQLFSVHFSRAILELRSACMIWEYTSAYDQPPPGGVISNWLSGIASRRLR